MRIQAAVCVVLFVGFLAAIAVQTAFQPLPEFFLYGVFKPIEEPVLSLRSWWDGRFQRQVQGTEQTEGWIDRHVGFRSVWIKTDGQINFSLFREIPTTANPQQIFLGKDNWLYEQDYIDNYLNLEVVPQRQLQQFAADLRSLQDELQRRGITMLLVISPSKATHYPEYLADWIVYQRDMLRRHDPGRRSNYEVLRPALEQEGVHCVDAAERFREERQKQRQAGQEYRLFTRGGTHWSHYGASLIVAEMLERLKELTGKDLLQLRCEKVSVDCRTTGTDNDLGDVLNVWTPWVTKGPTPHPHLLGTPGTWSPDVLWVGDSFSDALTELMDKYHVYRRRDTLFLFLRKTTYPERKTYPVDKANFDWEQELLTRDVVIIQINEAQLSDLGYGFVQAALVFLRGQTPDQGSGARGQGSGVKSQGSGVRGQGGVHQSSIINHQSSIINHQSSDPT
jgi:hypothetical protein